MYKLKYYSDFKDINDNSIRTEIYIDTDNILQSEELLLSSDAVNIEYTADDLFKPLKQSTCTINVLTKNVLTDLYTGKLNEVIAKIYKNGALFWYGFLTPNIYTSEFSSDYDLLSLEFIDSVAQLGNTKFTTTGKSITSFYSIISNILDVIDKEKVINEIYLHKSLTIDGETDLLNDLFILERNFQDEGEEPESNKEVMEDIISFLGMTLIQFGNKYLILDYEALKTGNYNFVVYDRTEGTVATETLTKDLRNIKEIGVAESNASISMGDVYTKVNVIANTNQIDSIIPEFDEDLVNQNEDANKYYEKVLERNGTQYKYLVAFFKSKGNWTYTKPYRRINSDKGEEAGDIIEVDEVTLDNLYSIREGILWQKCAEYKVEDGEPSSLKWKTYLSFIDRRGSVLVYSPVELKLGLNSDSEFVGSGGYLIADIKYKLALDDPIADVGAGDWFTDEKWSNTKYGAGFDDTMFPVRLMIGDTENDMWYYNGEEWEKYTDYLKRKSEGYYNLNNSFTGVTKMTWKGAVWYKIWREEWNRYEYVTEATYNSWSGEKYTGGFADVNKVYGASNNGIIFCEESYYLEVKNPTGFWLVHKNEEGESVFYTECSLTNTVSYKMNLAESSDGVAIPLPTDKLLYGRITFEILRCNMLGTIPMYRTDTACNQCTAIHISELILKYQTSKTVQDIFNSTEYEPDTIYSNVIDNDYVTELDDIALRVNSYSPNATSYSYVLTKQGDKYIYVQDVNNLSQAENKFMEKSIVQKYVNHYSNPKFIYSNTLNNKEIKPYTIIHEDIINKNLVINAATYKLSGDSVVVTAVEM